MKNWRNLFKPWILERGQEYYDCGQVVELKETDGVATAKVSGSQIYHVEIYRSGDGVRCMSCDCPYAADGENCKHMAAVLMALDRKTPRPEMDWQTALAQMEQRQLRTLLHDLATADRALQNRILRMVSGAGKDPAQWQDDLEDIISDYADDEGYLDYDQAYNCMVEVAAYLEECLPPLLEGGQILDSAKLVMTVCGVAWSQNMDDSDGGLSIVVEYCLEAAEKILSLATPQQEREIFDLFHELLEDSNWNYDSENLILSLSWSPELQQKNLEYLDENLDAWRLHQRADLMAQMGASKEEQITWLEQHRNDDGAYQPLLRLYEEADLSKAIELVREKQKLAHNTHWQLVDITKTLLRLLEKSENSKEYEKELRYLVLKLKCQEAEFISRLKKITPAEQWPGVFETLLEDAKWPGDRMRLYRFEGNYSGLFTELRRYPSLDNFQRYEEDLREWNLQQTLLLYTEILKMEMGRACGRKQYSYVASHLSKLCTYPCGQARAKELAAFWYVHHKNRPAMKDELKMAGYPQKL